MDYKRGGNRLLHDAAEWRRWREENDNLVMASGLPELIVSDADHWYDFLDHGIMDHHDDPLKFDVNQLTVRQKAFLLQLVGTDVSGYTTIVGLTLITNLISAVKQRYRE